MTADIEFCKLTIRVIGLQEATVRNQSGAPRRVLQVVAQSVVLAVPLGSAHLGGLILLQEGRAVLVDDRLHEKRTWKMTRKTVYYSKKKV